MTTATLTKNDSKLTEWAINEIGRNGWFCQLDLIEVVIFLSKHKDFVRAKADAELVIARLVEGGEIEADEHDFHGSPSYSTGRHFDRSRLKRLTVK